MSYRSAMHDRMTIGTYEVIPLLDGVDDTDHPEGMVEEFPGPSNEDWEPYRVLYPDLFGTSGGWRLPIRAWLVRDASHVIVVDTGVGPSTAPAMEWFPRPGSILDELAAAETEPAGVDSVVITHVHSDNLGGACTRDGAPAFPNARYLIHRADIAWMRSTGESDEENRAIWDLLAEPIASNGQLVEIDDAFEVAPGVRTRHLPGHTPGHQGVLLEANDASLLMTADTFNHPAQLDHPDWPGSSDNDPHTASALRRVMLEELVETGQLIAPSHFAEPFGTVAADAGRIVWRPGSAAVGSST